ncbi:MAG: hypothetical protein C5B54_01830, partial [Acidobacteria bacterium]
RLFYASLGSFAATALISIVGSALAFYNQQFGFHAAAVFSLITGLIGVGCLVVGCTIMVRETRIAMKFLMEDAQLTRTRFVPPA